MSEDEKYTSQEYAVIEAAIDARRNAADKGPWVVCENDVNIWIEDLDDNIIVKSMGSMENATFIAYARTDVDRLKAEISRLRLENNRLSKKTLNWYLLY